MVPDEVDEVNELPLKFQIGLKKESWKRLSNIYFRASDENWGLGRQGDVPNNSQTQRRPWAISKDDWLICALKWPNLEEGNAMS